MATATATVTSKGQVTIPVEVRRRLGIEPSDKIVFVYDESGPVQVQRMRYTIKDLAGIIPALPRDKVQDFDEQIREAFEEGMNQKFGGGIE
jgi:AbrB family looped-hinge helix DNA binding protein